MMVTLRDAINAAIRNNEVTGMWVLGAQGAGKTNTAKYVAHVLQNFEIRYMRSPSLVEAMACLKTPAEKDEILIIFDDLSFKTTYMSKMVADFLNAATQVRHTLKASEIFVVYNMHYYRGLAPFLRQHVHIRVLMSVSSEDLNKSNPSNLLQLFPSAELNTFRRLYDQMWWSGKFGIGRKLYSANEWRPALLQAMTRVTITAIPKMNFRFKEYRPPSDIVEEVKARYEKDRVPAVELAEKLLLMPIRAMELKMENGGGDLTDRLKREFKVGSLLANLVYKKIREPEYIGMLKRILDQYASSSFVVDSNKK